MIQSLDYFYDKQQYRFLEQVVRAFSGFQYMAGSRNGQPPQLQTVPCRMASTNKVVASIMRNQSENTVNATPMITVWQTGIEGEPNRLQNRAHVDTRQIVERAIDPETGKYTGARGQSYTLERIMPLPFKMTVQVDLWTSNLDQKYQLEEQILTIMYPSFDIQNSENALDWTALTTVYIDSITHSSRSIPIGTESEIDILTVNLSIPIWLSPPAKVRQQNLIEQIVTNINDQTPLPGVIADAQNPGMRFAQNITTPGNHHLKVDRGVMSLLGAGGQEHDEEGNAYDWRPFLDLYGFLRPAMSQIRLLKTDDVEGPSIIGTIQLDGGDPTKLIWQVDPDTLPSNTLAPVDAVINPMETYPNNGLPAAVNGVRYLIIQDIGPSQAWPGLSASTGDVIEFSGGAWSVVFDASLATTTQYILNLHSGTQLRWDGSDWVYAIDGMYAPGFWRIDL